MIFRVTRFLKHAIALIGILFLITACHPIRNNPPISAEISIVVCQSEHPDIIVESNLACWQRVQDACQMVGNKTNQEIREDLQRYLEEQSGCPMIYQLICELALQEHDPIASASYLEYAIQSSQEPNNLSAWRHSIDEKLQSELMISYREAISAGDHERALGAIQIRNRLFEPIAEMALMQIELEKQLNDYEAIAKVCDSLPENMRSEAIRIEAAKAFEALRQFDRAIEWLLPVMRGRPNEETQTYFKQLSALAREANQPDEIRNIKDKQWVTREDLAAVISWRFNFEKTGSPDTVLIDIQDSFARDSIIACVELGIMKAGRDHRFRPLTRIMRNDLAIACYEILQIKHFKFPDSLNASPWDIPPGHFAALPIEMGIQLGYLDLLDDGSFQGGRQPGGASVVEALSKVEQMILSQAD